MAHDGCPGNRALLPPSFAANIDDEDEEREEEDVGDEEGCEDGNCRSVAKFE